MRTKVEVLLVLGALVALTAAGRADEPMAAPSPAADPAVAVETPAADGTVPMVRLELPGRTVEGRLVYEDDVLLRVEPIGAGIIGYTRATVRDMQRFTITAAAFAERQGDFHLGRAWEAEDPPAEFVRARQAYQRAVLAGLTTEDRDRINAKLEVLSDEREEWQQEALRMQELDYGRHQIDLAVLEKQLTSQRIEALQRQEQELAALRTAVQRLQADGQFLTQVVENMQADLMDLRDDVHDLGNVFVHVNTFADLRRAHDRLERDVQRLERAIERR